MCSMAAARGVIKTVVVKLAKFTYTWPGGWGACWVGKRVAGCRITANYATKDDVQGAGSGVIRAAKVRMFRRITGAAPWETKTFFGMGV